MRSTSMTVAPRSASSRATVDLPAPMPPQRPMTRSRAVTCRPGESEGGGDEAVVAVVAAVEHLAPARARFSEEHERLVTLV